MHKTKINTRFILTVSIAVILITITIKPLYSDEWNRFRGPDGNGITSDSNWDPTAISQKKVLWTTELGRGYSAVSIMGNNLYTMGNKNKMDIIYCIDIRSGTLIWQYKYECGAGSYPGPRATPYVTDKYVYTISREGYMLCLKADTGKRVWHRDLADKYDVPPPKWGFAGSPIIEDNMVIINVGQWGIALTADKGKKMWVSPTKKSGYSTHTFFTSDGKKLAAVLGNNALYVIDRTTGDKIDSYSWMTSYDVNVANPLIIGNDFLISSAYGSGSALMKFDGTTLTKGWTVKSLGSHFSTPIYLDGYIYGADHDVNDGIKDFVCLDAKTGEEQWRKTIGIASMIMADNKFIILNESGDLWVVKPDPKKWNEISSCTGLVPKRCWTAPVLANGKIFIRNDSGRLLCLDVSK